MTKRERKPRKTGMFPITVRLPDDLIEAINQATVADGRPSASDLVRVILHNYLKTHGYYRRDKPEPESPE